jgi:coenzyme PQQ precursor peptide PqqA
MEWHKPEIIEIRMDAEVTAYQDDFGDDANVPVIDPAPPVLETKPNQQ